MRKTTNSGRLRDAIVALKAHGVVPAISAAMAPAAAVIATELEERILDEVDAFTRSANPDILPQLGQHLRALVGEVCKLLEDTGLDDLEFIERYARQLAQQRFPLEALLHSYRCSHRILAVWLRDAALEVADSPAQARRAVAAAADFAIELNDAISTIATSEYVAHTRRLAQAEGDRRTQLLDTLLGGYDESDGHVAQLLKRSGYLQQRQSFCVAAARSVDPREMENAARAQRMADSVSDILRDTPVRSLVGIREGLVIVVMSAQRRLSGWTAPQSHLADRMSRSLEKLGPAALVGLSNDAPSTTHIRRGLDEARLALDFANVGNRVMSFSQIPFQQMVLRHARDRIRSALPAWCAEFRTADLKSHGALSTTLFAYADANMNAQQAAKNLSIHTNTVYSRMQKIAHITGKNALHYHDLTELLLAIESGAEVRREPTGVAGES